MLPNTRQETYDFRLSRSDTYCMECKVRKKKKRKSTSSLEAKIGDHTIPQVTQLKYLGSINI